jgi:rhomboid protease GluP
MLTRQTSGPCVCIYCKQLISVNDPVCPQCNHKNPSLWGYSRSLRRLGADLGFTAIVTWGCVALYLGTLLLDWNHVTTSGISRILAPSSSSLVLFGATGQIPVFELGRWWTVLSTGWLHGSLLHVVFNLLWIRSLVPQVATAFGAGRLVILYTVAIAVGGLLSSLAGHFFQGVPILAGSQLAIGASGGLFGLLGALVAYGQIQKDFTARQDAWVLAIVLFVFGFLTPHVDNWGHLGGFLGGYLISWVPGINPRKPETLRHLCLAIGCLVLTATSVLASLIHSYYWNFFDIFSS